MIKAYIIRLIVYDLKSEIKLTLVIEILTMIISGDRERSRRNRKQLLDLEESDLY